MPYHRFDRMSKPRFFHTPKQSAINGASIFRIHLVALVHINAGATHSAIDKADGDFVSFHQSSAKLHAPISNLGIFVFATTMNRISPIFQSGSIRARRGTAKASNPFATKFRIFLTNIRSNSVGLTLNQVGITTHKIFCLVHDNLFTIFFGN